ncbi:MAG: hypothetical protein PHT99_08075, partial [Methanoregula sp.]|nr:hypothetical protein [Methanoregula sp.]
MKYALILENYDLNYNKIHNPAPESPTENRNPERVSPKIPRSNQFSDGVPSGTQNIHSGPSP